MFGTTQADAFRSEGARQRRVFGCVRVRANLHASRLVAPAHEAVEGRVQFGQDHGNLAEIHFAFRAVDRNKVAFVQGCLADVERFVCSIDHQLARAADAGASHAARDHGGMACHAAAGGEDSFCGVHAVNVFGRSFQAHQHDLLTVARAFFCCVGAEDDLPASGAWGCGQSAREQHLFCVRIESRVQQLVERLGFDME